MPGGAIGRNGASRFVGRVTNALRLKPGQDRIGTLVGADRTRARPDYPRSFGE